jgi:hypothetical protein
MAKEAEGRALHVRPCQHPQRVAPNSFYRRPKITLPSPETESPPSIAKAGRCASRGLSRLNADKLGKTNVSTRTILRVPRS